MLAGDCTGNRTPAKASLYLVLCLGTVRARTRLLGRLPAANAFACE